MRTGPANWPSRAARAAPARALRLASIKPSSLQRGPALCRGAPRRGRPCRPLTHAVIRTRSPLHPAQFGDDVYGQLAGNGDCQVITSIIAAAGLEGKLGDEGKQYTIFAPDDEAMSEYARSMGTTKMELMRSLQVGAIANARAFANAHIVEVRASRRPAGCGVGALEMARLPFINDWGRCRFPPSDRA